MAAATDAPTRPVLTADHINRLEGARIKIVSGDGSNKGKGFGRPYYSQALFAMSAPIATNEIPTMAVDHKWRFYVNPDFVDRLTADEIAVGLLHEVNHLLRVHPDRAAAIGVSPEESKMWNIACFPAGTLLPGGVPIESVADIVNDFDGELVSITTQAGVVEATPDHPFFVRRLRYRNHYPIVTHDPEWVGAGDVAERDYLCAPRLLDKRADDRIDLAGYAVKHTRAGTTKVGISNRTVRSIPLDADVAWLIGLYVAEGDSSPNVRFSLGSHETDLMDRVEKIADKIGFSASRSVKGSRAAVNLGAVVFGRWLKENCGESAATKRIPKVILHHADAAVRSAFLEGLVAGDGCQRNWNADGSHRNWTVATASKALMHDVILLLAQDGLGGHSRVQAQRERSIDGTPLPDGWLYGVTWNPKGVRSSERVLNGKAITSHSHRWRADEDGVWYPITKIERRRFVGTVYNLTTDSHTYVAHSYLVHNCDAEINQDIISDGFEMPDWVVLPQSFGAPDGLTAEEYFALLRKKVEQQQQADGGSGEGAGQDGEGDDDGGSGDGSGGGSDSSDDGQQSAGASAGEQAPGDCGSCAGGKARGWENSDEPGIGASHGETIRRAVAREVIAHAKSRGTVPAGLRRWAEDLIGSKVDWRAVLGAMIRNAVAQTQGKVDYTYTRMNRRTTGQVIFPALRAPVPDVVTVVDTSGSMSQQDLAEALGEVEGMIRQTGCGAGNMRVISCDAATGTVQRVTTARQIELEGGGGTDMRIGINDALDLKPRPNVIVVLSDGYSPWPDQPTAIPVVVGIVGANEGAHQDEFGIPEWIPTVFIERD